MSATGTVLTPLEFLACRYCASGGREERERGRERKREREREGERERDDYNDVSYFQYNAVTKNQEVLPSRNVTDMMVNREAIFPTTSNIP